MHSRHQARWISKGRLEQLRRARSSGRGVVLESFSGFLIVEPKGSDLGDGPVLSHQEADYELRPVWCAGNKTRLKEARELLGLGAEAVINEQRFAEMAS
jgi:hypothetical protein